MAHPHASCPFCNPQPEPVEPSFEELVQWFVDNRWGSSYQEQVSRFLRLYKVVKRD